MTKQLLIEKFISRVIAGEAKSTTPYAKRILMDAAQPQTNMGDYFGWGDSGYTNGMSYGFHTPEGFVELYYEKCNDNGTWIEYNHLDNDLLTKLKTF